MIRPTRLLCALAVCAAALASAQTARAQIAYGVTSAGQLFRFDVSSPSRVTPVGTLGFVPEAIGFRPGTQTLYALDAGPVTARLYTVSLATGAATPVGAVLPSGVSGQPSGNYGLLGEAAGRVDTTADFPGGLAVLPQVAAAGSILISELRLSGPGVPDVTEGNTNEFIELYNNSDADVVVTTSDGSAGWAVVSSSDAAPPGGTRTDALAATTLFVIPNGTVIPARGHYLATHATGFSLGGYPAGSSTVGAGDIQYNFDNPGDAGIAVFNTANAANFAAATRLDAVGFAPPAGAVAGGKRGAVPQVTDPLYYETAPIPHVVFTGNEHSWVRRLETGRPLDTDNNPNDFVLVSTFPGQFEGFLPAVLGAPGPQSTRSPVQRNNLVKASLIDANCFATNDPALACGRTRYTSETGAHRTFGTLRIRRKWTNNTGRNVTRLRFRVVDITTLHSPNLCDGCDQADVRALSSTNETGLIVGNGGGTADTVGLTLEEPPDQSEAGGGLNSSLTVATVTPDTPLAPGASVNVNFLLGVEQQGTFRYYVNVEILTAAPLAGFETPKARPRHRGARGRRH